jgi:sugar phosphate isomerase/epimerase
MRTFHNRREFLKVTAAGAFGVIALSQFGCRKIGGNAASDRKRFGVGLGMYTVRDLMGVDRPVDPAQKIATLKKVSDLGYKYLEPANYSNGLFYGYTPRELKSIPNDLGLEIMSSHTQVEAKGITLDNARKMADDHAALGVKYCVQPWIVEEARNTDSYHRMIEDWNEIGGIMKDAGIQFAYHNHNFEFEPVNGIVPYYDIFLKEMDPALIKMELDIFWAAKAGQNAVDMFNKYPGRFELWHMKDMFSSEPPFYVPSSNDFAPVGAGLIDWKSITAARDKAGLKYFFVEQDSQGYNSLSSSGRVEMAAQPDAEMTYRSLETSIDNLTKSILV